MKAWLIAVLLSGCSNVHVVQEEKARLKLDLPWEACKMTMKGRRVFLKCEYDYDMKRGR